MKLSLASLGVLSCTLAIVSCSTQETDGRHYHGSNLPVQGRTGVHFTRVAVDNPAPAQAPSAPDDSLLGSMGFGRNADSQPPGLLDRNEKPDEPGAKYWMHAQQSANPVQNRTGVVVSRRKK